MESAANWIVSVRVSPQVEPRFLAEDPEVIGLEHRGADWVVLDEAVCSAPTVHAAIEAATCLVDRLNGLLRLEGHRSDGPLLHLGGVSDQQGTLLVGLQPADLTMKFLAATLSHAGDPPPRSLYEVVNDLANPLLGEALERFARSDLRWFELRNIYELVREGTNRFDGIRTSPDERERFFRTASSPLSGRDASHAIPDLAKQPDEPMTRPEGVDFAASLLLDWIRMEDTKSTV